MENDLQVGDRVTYEDGYIEIMHSNKLINIRKDDKIIKIERPKYEVVEEKKELLTKEEKEFLKDMIKYYEIKTIIFATDAIELWGKGVVNNVPDYPNGLEFENVERNKKYTLKDLGLEEN